MKRVLIDADGCPVVDECITLAKRHNFECLILCDTAHRIEREGARTLLFSTGADSVDFALVNMVQKGDIVVTQDYGLAAMCLARGGRALNQDGMEYTSDNIDQLLLVRHTHKKIRAGGGRTRGPKKRSNVQNENFMQQLEKMLKE